MMQVGGCRVKKKAVMLLEEPWVADKNDSKGAEHL